MHYKLHYMSPSYIKHNLSEAISVPTKKSPKKPTKTSKNRKTTVKVAKTVPQRPSNSAPSATLTGRALRKLQKQWYAKIKKLDPNFKDIEAGLEGGRINGQSSSDARFHERYINNSASTQHYYSRWSCYLAHHDNGQLLPIEKAVIELYSQGLGVTDMYKFVKRYINKFQLHYMIERLKAHVELWNKTNPNGMDFETDVDNVWPLKK